MLYRVFAYYLAALVLLTNVGIPVFTHVCHGQGKAWSSLLRPTEACCSKQKVAKSDCEANPPAQGIHPKSCCENYTDLLQIQSDFLLGNEPSGSKNVDHAIVPVPPFTALFSTPALYSASVSFQPHAPPVALYGRSLLVFKQVFRC